MVLRGASTAGQGIIQVRAERTDDPRSATDRHDVEDCHAALAWALAASLALLARDRGDHRLAFQHLIHPMIDDPTCVVVPGNPFTGEFVWTPDKNRFGWASLLGHEPGAPGVSPYAAAARATDLAGRPPTFIAVGSLDLFVDKDLDYARRLASAGVPTELHVYPGAFHGFHLDPSATVTRTANRDSLDALRRALASRSARPHTVFAFWLPELDI